MRREGILETATPLESTFHLPIIIIICIAKHVESIVEYISAVEAPSVGKSSSNTYFAWGGRLGTTIWTSSKLGIKLQAQILSASKATGGDYYWSWYGPVYLSTYSTLWQFSLGGGLAFKLGK